MITKLRNKIKGYLLILICRKKLKILMSQGIILIKLRLFVHTNEVFKTKLNVVCCAKCLLAVFVTSNIKPLAKPNISALFFVLLQYVLVQRQVSLVCH